MDTYNYGTRRSQIQPESNTAKFRPKLPRRNLSQMYYNTSCLRRCRNLPLRMCLVSWLSTSAARGGNFRAFCTTVAGRLTQPLGVRGSSSVFHCREKKSGDGGARWADAIVRTFHGWASGMSSEETQNWCRPSEALLQVCSCGNASFLKP